MITRLLDESRSATQGQASRSRDQGSEGPVILAPPCDRARRFTPAGFSLSIKFHSTNRSTLRWSDSFRHKNAPDDAGAFDVL
jgi:hypothetical protein